MSSRRWKLLPVMVISTAAFLAGLPVIATESDDGFTEKARAIEELLAEFPDDVESMVRAGNLYFDAQEWERAKHWYMRSLEHEPDNPAVLTDLGVAYRSLEQFEPALLAFNAALALEPSHWQAIYNKSVVLGLDLGRPDEALRLLETLNELRVDNPSIADSTALKNFLLQASEVPDPSEKARDVVRLLELSGVADVAQVVMTDLVDSFSGVFPDVPEEFWQEVAQAMDTREFIGLVAPVYERHFTHQDILEMIAFYETPVGRKLVRLQPVITQELMSRGKEWGEAKAKEIISRLSEAGHVPTQES